MHSLKKIAVGFFLFLCVALSGHTQGILSVKSPDGKLEVQVTIKGGEMFYHISSAGKSIIQSSPLGLVREDADFSRSLSFVTASALEKGSDNYRMVNSKKSHSVYKANKRIFHFQQAGGGRMNVVFQVSNDGVAFRYHFPGKKDGRKTITEERTGFRFGPATKAWLQPMQEAKTGWEQTNPAYEEHYEQGIAVATPSTLKVGWVYPALFQVENTWVAISEAAVDGSYCATRLQSATPDGLYRIGFPDKREVMYEGGLLPQVQMPSFSPWRIIAIGSLKTITESTLGTDLAVPAKDPVPAFVKPGKASWSWINSKDDFITYDEQKRYIDFAAGMKWQYCLIDADWDRKIGYEKVTELSAYAAAKGVGLLLWYNSAGNWNTVKYTPQNKLLTAESRAAEFSRLKGMGIKGVKIDFFGGDGRSVMQYYHEILNDAAQYGLMVNFHGATLPRGWHRTYPHLMTTEAVRGFEMITFNQSDADREATHCAMLPFTRNLYDPMDFTPMNLYRIQTQVKRKTTAAFELALSVLFQSGLQHFAESPEGMKHVSASVQQFLRELPVKWDDIRFLDGYPGRFVVLARRSGTKWYIAGINAEAGTKVVQLPLSVFNKKEVTIITDGEGNEASFSVTKEKSRNRLQEISIKPNGGFVIVLQ